VTGPHLSNGDTPTHPLPSGLIHELRTPLNAIIGYSEMLIEQTQEQGQDGLLPDLQRILNAGQQLHALINANFHPVRALESFADLSALREEAATPIETKAAETFSKSAPDGAPIARPTYGFLLVVDDIEANRDVLSRRLKSQGHGQKRATGAGDPTRCQFRPRPSRRTKRREWPEFMSKEAKPLLDYQLHDQASALFCPVKAREMTIGK
jgi:hypothetical protein